MSSNQATCWECAEHFRDGVQVNSGGVCAACIAASGLTPHDAAAILPHVWGQCSSRLARAELILEGLTE